MFQFRKWLPLIAVLGLLAAASQAQATLVLPGQTGLPPDVQATSTPGTVIADTGVLLGNAGLTSVTFQQLVVREATGTLDFLYQVSNLNSAGGDSVLRVTSQTFTGFLTDAGYSVDSLFFANDGTIIPTTVDRSASGSTVGFNITIPPGATSVELFVHTNATQFTTGLSSVIDGGAVNFASFAPTAAPAPAGIVLALSGLPCLGIGHWLRRRRQQA